MPTKHFCSRCGALNAPEKTVCFACQQPLDSNSGSPEPSAATSMLLFGRYRLLSQLGSGRFSTVYRAQDTCKQNGIVALKQISLEHLSAQEAIEATDTFHREAALLSALSHPQIPHLHDQLSDTRHWYLVVDFIEGQTLESYLAQQPARLPVAEVLSIGRSLCAVLDYLHTREPPVICRDLKPSNIMYARSGQISLIDFGIARRFKPNQKHDTIPFGTPGYAAPEQYGSAQTTPQSDIYSLGVLLYQLLSGRDPAEPSFQLAPLSLSHVAGGKKLNTLMVAMTSPAMSKRPKSINVVADELRQIQRLQGRAPIWTPPQSHPLPSSPIVPPQVRADSFGQQQYYWPGNKQPQPVQPAQPAYQFQHSRPPRQSLVPQMNSARQALQRWDKDAPRKWKVKFYTGAGWPPIIYKNPRYKLEKALWSMQFDPLASSSQQAIIRRTRQVVLLIIGAVMLLVVVIGLLIWLSSMM